MKTKIAVEKVGNMHDIVYDFGQVASTDALCDLLEGTDAVAFKTAVLTKIKKGITNNQYLLVEDACVIVVNDVIKKGKEEEEVSKPCMSCDVECPD